MSSTVQPVTEELRRWIVSQAEMGCRPEDVLQAMVKSGWNEDVAMQAMEATLRDRLQSLGLPQPDEPAAAAAPATAQPGAARALPEPALADARTALFALDRHVTVLAALQSPRVVVFGGLLSDDECEALIAAATPRLLRSETVDNQTGGSEVNAARTSEGMFFERGETALIERIERRIAALVNWPLENGEGIQILRYAPGAEYKPHHDYFDPIHPGTATILRRGGQRVGTVVMYLHTTTKGGATVFPEIGLQVAPVRGNAVFFAYDRPHPSTKTLHGGAPVIEGVKWVATKWMREGVFV